MGDETKTAETWQVIDETGAAHGVVVQWDDGDDAEAWPVGERDRGREGTTARAAIARLAGAQGWAVVEVLAPGQETRAAEVAHLEARRGALLAEVDRLRGIIAGRTVAPTDAEITAHHAVGGSWLHAYGSTHDVIDVMRVAAAKRDGLAAHGIASTWWALDAQSRPCAWPGTGGAQ